MAVQIGQILSHNDAMVDGFNALVMDIFNLAPGSFTKATISKA